MCTGFVAVIHLHAPFVLQFFIINITLARYFTASYNRICKTKPYCQINAGMVVILKPNPHLHSQSYLSYEYILLCTTCCTKCRQCIVSTTFTNVVRTITNIPATVVRVAVLLPSILLAQ